MTADDPRADAEGSHEEAPPAEEARAASGELEQAAAADAAPPAKDEAPLDQDTAEDLGAEKPLPLWRRGQALGLWWILPVGCIVALVVTARGDVRPGGLIMAGTFALAALCRLVLPRKAVGGLQVRSRTWDILILLALAAGLAVLSLTIELDAVRQIQ